MASPSVDDLLNKWEDARAEGLPLTAEELCRDCPDRLAEVRRQISELAAIDGMLDTNPPANYPAGTSTLAGTTTIDHPPTIPETADRYRIVQRHAEGALGEVLLARDQVLDRAVALKRIRGHRANEPGLQQRFLREAAITGQLQHPGVVPIYDLTVDSKGRASYAMRFIEGESLDEAINRLHGKPAAIRPDDKFTGTEFRGLLQRFVIVCNTVAYAHAQGVIHRDLKPANVMLGPFGETLVVDWGLAKRLAITDSELSAAGAMKAAPVESDDAATRLGSLIGTPAYMSPEQADCRVRDIGPASDIFALGAILYAILTGRAPYLGKLSDMVLEDASAGNYKPPRTVNPQAPAALDAVCCKAMAIRPRERYRSPLDLAREVERWLADEPVTAWKEPRGPRIRRWGRRHRGAVIAGGVTGLLTIVAGIVGLILWGMADRRHALQAQSYSAELRRQAEVSEQLGLSELQIGRFESAAEAFRKSAAAVQQDPLMDGLHARMEYRHDMAARLAGFYRLTWQAEMLMLEDMDDPAAKAYAEAAKILAVFDSKDWWNHLPVEDLTPHQQERLRRDVRLQLTNLAGIKARQGEALLVKGRMNDARPFLREALRATEAAQRYKQIHCLALILPYLRLLLHEAPQSTDAPPATVDKDTHIDNYAYGILHLWVSEVPNDPVSQVFLRMAPFVDQKAPPLETAERHLRRAASLDPEHYFTHHWLGYVLIQAHKYPDAELAFGACIGLRPEIPFGYVMRGQSVLRQMNDGDAPDRSGELLARAMTNFDDALRLDPKSWAAMGGRASAHQKAGHPELAVEDLTAAIEVMPAERPDRFSYFKDRGEVYRQLKRYPDALRDFTQAIALCPDPVRYARFDIRGCYLERGRTHLEVSQYEEAVEDLTKALGGKPRTQAAAQSLRALALARLGRFADASGDAEAAARSNSASATDLINAARALTLAGPREHAGRAVELLRTGMAKGCTDIPNFLVDADLASLRGRADYADLLWDLADAPAR